MNSIPKDKILEFNNDTFSYLRKYYNYDKPGEMDQAIDLLDDWVKKQPHLINKEYSREYLERTIILMKGSKERSKKQIERLATLKTLMPHMFDKYDAKNDFSDSNGIIAQGLLPKLTKDHYRIFALKFLRGGMTSKTYLDCYRNGIMISEYMKAHDYCNGCVGIVDYRSVNLAEIISAVNLFDINEFVTTLNEGFAMRIKGIHLISNSKLVEVVLGIFKKALGPKVGNRIHFHHDLESLYEYVPKDILPVEFGGPERSLVKLYDEWTELFSTKENYEYFKKVSKHSTDEKYRDNAKFNEMYMGVSGSFRNMNVD